MLRENVLTNFETSDIRSADDLDSLNIAAIREPRLRLKTFASLRHRDFRLLWIGTILITCALWVQQITVGWMVYDMTGSGALLGAVIGVQAIPSFFGAPIAGALTDRMDRRLLLIVAQVGLLVTVLPMAVLTLADIVEVWHLFVFSLLSRTAWTFIDPVRISLVPNLVPEKDLLNAYSLNAAAYQSMAILGPAVGGFMIAWFSPGGNFLIQSVAILCIIGIAAIMRVPSRSAPVNKMSITQNMIQGFRYVQDDRVVRALIVIGIIPSLVIWPVPSLMPIFAVDVLDVGAVGLGIMLSTAGAGALAGAILLASVRNVQRKGLLMLSAIGMTGIALVAFSHSEWLALSLFFLLFMGVGEMSYFSSNNTILQTIVPDELRGRVTSIYMLTWGIAPLGTLSAGALADVIGAPLTVAILGAATIVFAILAGWKFPYVRDIA